MIGLNDFTQFVTDCNLPDPSSKYLRKADIDRLFIAVDTASKATEEEESDGMNRAKALSADEFVNAIVQLAAMKYILPVRDKDKAAKGAGSGEVPTVACAITSLFDNDVSQLDPNAFLDANAFRRTQCYKEAMDSVLRHHEPSLRTLFGALQIQRGPAKGLLNFDGWFKLMRRLELIQVDLTERDVNLAFTWSRMVVPHPYSTAGALRNQNLSFEGFLEALCRIAAVKALPTDEQVAEAGHEDAGSYLAALRADSPAAHEALTLTQGRPWGGTPFQPVQRGVNQLVHIIMHTVTQSVAKSSKRSASSLTEKDFKLFLKAEA